MKERIFKYIKRYLISTLVFSFSIAIAGFLPYREYLCMLVLYVAFNYYMVLGIARMGGKDRSRENLYEWLDVLDGSENFIKKLVVHEKNEDVITNLETVFDKLMFITNQDKKKLRLLKGYFKTVADEGPYDLFFKTLLTILIAISAWGVNKGFVLSISKGYIEGINIIDPTFFVYCNYLTIVFLGSVFLAVLIKIYFKEKIRLKIIIEIIDTCIEDIKNNKRS